MDSLFGYIERITFHNADTGYTIAQLQESGRRELTCIVGVMPGIKPGETIRCKGGWKQHLVHGRQFAVAECHIEAPADLIGIRKYLGSGLIDGIGPVLAGRIVDVFKEESLHIIDQKPERLLEVEGLGKKKLESILSAWGDQRTIRDLMIFIQSLGISPTFAQKIYKVYGKQSISQIKEDPYQLARDIFSIGFKTADTIAQKVGIEPNSPRRIEAGIEFVLSELSGEGHVCYPARLLTEEAEKYLCVDKALIFSCLETLHREQRTHQMELTAVGKRELFIWTRKLFASESGIGREIVRLKKSPCLLRKIQEEKALHWVQTTLNLQLAENQKRAVICALSEKIHIITGGPGTGKSTITKAILAITGKLTPKILLAAPTGRAAKRMTEITGRKAVTIHSLLEYDFKGGFKRNREKPLDCDLIIVDEASMIDTFLMYNLLKAIPSHARLILVGDINQLPSVGPGNVLRDIIQSQATSVTMLNEIFRQAAGSRIVTNAHRINSGVMPDIHNSAESDFFFVEAKEPEDVLQQIISLIVQRVPNKYKLDPWNDIQVLAPMKKGIVGIENLNATLQKILNPKNEGIFHGGRQLLVGDKVMQIRNDYQRKVFNGDMGRIIDIDPQENSLMVKFDELEVNYEMRDLDELALSYAVSIHKFQGSECPCVIIPVHTTHFKLLNRNLLYTAVTRGRRLVILVGTTQALGIAVRNDEVKQRYTGLQQALMEYIR